MRSFLESVLPDEGYYAALAISAGHRQQKFFTSIDDLIAYTTAVDAEHDVYYAVGSFREFGKRTQDNVLLKKAFYIDVDCGEGKPYNTQNEGCDALVKFVKQAKLPAPTILSSGRGIHAYWILPEAIDAASWQLVADRLKTTTEVYGFSADPAVTADSARVLRSVGTTNKKCGRIVSVLLSSPCIDLMNFVGAIKTALGTRGANPVISNPIRSTRVSRTSTILDDMGTEQDFPPCNSFVIEQKCAAIAFAIKNPNDVPEPMWYKMMGLAAYCIDPEETAVRWSQGYEGFDRDNTIRKMEQYRRSTSGTPLCESFARDCKACAKCPFRAKGIRTPWALAKSYEETEVTDPDVVDYDVLPLPRPYKRTKAGIFLTVDGVDIEVCDFDVFPVRYGRDETVSAETVHFKWYRQNVGWSDLTLPNHHLFTQASRDFVVQIGSQGILLRDSNQVGLFQTMLKDYIRELRKQSALTNIYTSMGWKEDKQVFVLGDTIYKRQQDGTVTEEHVTLTHGVSSTYNDMFDTAGSADEWIKFTQVLDNLHLPYHQFALGVAFSAPLYAFTGLKGSVLSLYGETGGGKTLAQKWMQSVYGNPDLLHYASNFTANAVFHRMSLLSSLPMTIDEATKIDPDFLGDFVYTVTQGRDKARLNRSATEMAPRTWALPAVMSTNISLATKLANAGYSSDAQMLRLFEIEVPVSKVFSDGSDAGRDIHRFLSSNYGLVGREYIKGLLRKGAGVVQKDVDDAIKGFSKEFSFSFAGTERYWEQLIVLSYLGLRYAKEMGLIMFEAKPPIVAVVNQITGSRINMSENKRDVFDLIAAFCNEYAEASVTAMYTAGNPLPMIDLVRQPKNGIYIRYNLTRVKAGAPFTRGVILLHANCFRNWLATQGVDSKSFMRQLTEAGANVTPENTKASRYSLGKGTSIKTGQVYTIRVSMNHERLASMLGETVETGDDEMTAPIKLVV